MDKHWGKVKWGPQGKRVKTSPQYWEKPLKKWNDSFWVQCEVCGWRGVYDAHATCPVCQHPMIAVMVKTRQRVFCASLADIFELKEDQKEEMDQWRAELFQLIEQTQNLDWLLLTKRPENIVQMIPWDGFDKPIPTNIIWGFSAENQKEFDGRVPLMESFSYIYHQTYFVSIEPMLGKIDISGWLYEEDWGDEDAPRWTSPIDWVICGGESGPEARPMHPDWVRSLRDQCEEANVPFLFKQWGEWMPVADVYADDGPDKAFEYFEYWLAQMEPDGSIPVLSAAVDKEGGWFEYQPCPGSWFIAQVGKKSAGRLLDGIEWNGFPR